MERTFHPCASLGRPVILAESDSWIAIIKPGFKEKKCPRGCPEPTGTW
jgi:hypothetical protein